MHWQKRLWAMGLLVLAAAGGLRATAQDANGFPVGDLKHEQAGSAEYWHLSGIGLSAPAQGVSQVTGNGRMLLSTNGSRMTLLSGGLKTVLLPGSVVFVDQVAGEIRLMVLAGKAKVTDGARQFKLTPSLQAVLNPKNGAGYFINDGIYRRPVMQTLESPGWKTLVRQFYLEQVVYADPMLRALYQSDPHAKRLIDRINKTAAILRDLNGTGNYEQGQV